MALRGVISLLNVRPPPIDDCDTGDIRRLALTSDTPTWYLSSTSSEEQEKAIVGYDGLVYDPPALRGQLGAMLVTNPLVSSTQPAADVDDNFTRALASTLMISRADTSLPGHPRASAYKPLDFRTLSAWWMIPLAQTTKTITLPKFADTAEARLDIHPPFGWC